MPRTSSTICGRRSVSQATPVGSRPVVARLFAVLGRALPVAWPHARQVVAVHAAADELDVVGVADVLALVAARGLADGEHRGAGERQRRHDAREQRGDTALRASASRCRRPCHAVPPLSGIVPLVQAPGYPILTRHIHASSEVERETPHRMSATRLVDVDRILQARDLLAGIVRTTPMEHAREFSDAFGGPVHLKCENLQRTGSFKVRGAYTRIHGLSAEERERGVVAASAGNHAQGVALAASLVGTASTVFMSRKAPLPKVAATRGYGADVHLVGAELEEAFTAAIEFAERTGAVFIHPFDHPDIIAGQGTVGLEILEQVPDVRTVLVSTGGGGLVAGVA